MCCAGEWWGRLSIDLEHLGDEEGALVAAEAGLRDAWVRHGDRLALQVRPTSHHLICLTFCVCWRQRALGACLQRNMQIVHGWSVLNSRGMAALDVPTKGAPC